MKKLISVIIILLLTLTVSLALFACGDTQSEQFAVNYTYTEGGNIIGDESQTVTLGGNASPVIAKPSTGYKFIKWSDNNSTNPERVDTNVNADVNATAEFAMLTYSVNYTTDGNGSIGGNESQTIAYNQNAETITAIPSTGYKFLKWADTGNAEPERTDTDITAEINAMAEFERIAFQASYRTNGDGRVVGRTAQVVLYGDDAQAVTAIANAGYIFAKWSDGVASATRQDTEILADLSVTAIFIRPTQTLVYEYNGASGNNTEQEIILAWDKLDEAAFAIPKKDNYEFSGWYLEPEFINKATNGVGNLLIGIEVLIKNSGHLYAKWNPSDIPTYKILLVFVTGFNGKLFSTKTGDEDPVLIVDYAMSATQRRNCELIPINFSKYLNDWFLGTVNFEVDVYFTTSLGRASISTYSSIENGNYNSYSYIDAKKIPELSEMIGAYQSVITTFCFNDYNYLFRPDLALGFYYSDFSYVYLDWFSQWTDLTDMHWEWIIEAYLHEFTHIVENRVQPKQSHTFHEVLDYYYPNLKELDVIKLYLLNQSIINNNTVGIPYSFWESETNTAVA